MSTYRLQYRRESVMCVHIRLERKLLWTWWYIDHWRIRNSEMSQMFADAQELINKLKTRYNIDENNLLGSIKSNITEF